MELVGVSLVLMVQIIKEGSWSKGERGDGRFGAWEWEKRPLELEISLAGGGEW